MNRHEISNETWLVTGARDRTPGEPLNTPPVLASNFFLPHERLYSRTDGTATSDGLEDLLGPLEGGRALVFGSGMGAAATILHALPVGATLVIPNDPYHAVKGIAAEGEAQGRWMVQRLALDDTAAWCQAATHADLLWLESPANPLMTVADLPAICGAPRRDGCVVAVDSTFATPLLQRPLDLGADVVMHSATKFIGGHSDLLAGVLITNRDDLYDDYHDRRLRNGATIGALEAFLTMRGARTLAMRLERAQSNAAVLADRLVEHREVISVRFPGLTSDPNHAVAKSFMTGFGSMLSFETTGPGERATRVCEAVRTICHATSLGGVETSMERRAVIAGQETIPATLIRLSVGCENVEDLWDDLDQALVSTAAAALGE